MAKEYSNLRRSQRIMEKSNFNCSMDILDEMPSEKLPFNQEMLIQKVPSHIDAGCNDHKAYIHSSAPLRTQNRNKDIKVSMSTSQRTHNKLSQRKQQSLSETKPEIYGRKPFATALQKLPVNQTFSLRQKQNKDIHDINSTSQRSQSKTYQRKQQRRVSGKQTETREKKPPATVKVPKRVRMKTFISKKENQKYYRSQPVKRSKMVMEMEEERDTEEEEFAFFDYPPIPPPSPKVMRIERYFDNGAYPFYSKSRSMLPAVYPPHFTNQLPHNSQTLDAALAAASSSVAPLPYRNSETELYPTPDWTFSWDEQSASTPSLTDSLRGIFQANDIRELLSMEKIVYRLCQHHVLALALVLNLKVESLNNLLDAIVKLNTATVQQISNIFACTEQTEAHQTEMASKHSPTTTSDDSIIEGSPTASTSQARYFPSQRQIFTQ